MAQPPQGRGPGGGAPRRSNPPPTPGALPDAWVQKLEWRSIGPANMGGRITALAVYEKDPSTFWVATASGGLLKTVNNGVTFQHQFDREATVSIGDVEVAQSDPNIVWVGTGESNPRNSVSWGDGVYKSTDGGATWKNMGLRNSFQVGRIAVHPTDPNIVLVGVLGRLWGPSEERGLYKTTDGGATWKRVLFVDDKTGVIDVQFHPADPKIVLAATYERLRDGFDGNDPIKKYGPGAGIYRSGDGGESFTKVSAGLPAVNLGRIGFDFYRAKPEWVYAIIESEKIAQLPPDFPHLPVRSGDAPVGALIQQVPEDSPAAKAGVKANDVVIAVDGAVVHSNEQMWSAIRRKKAGDKVRLEISRERKPVIVELELEQAVVPATPAGGEANESGGETPVAEAQPAPAADAGEGEAGRGRREGRGRGDAAANRPRVQNPFTGVLGGQAANLQDQQGAQAADYGGIYLSEDAGLSWRRINTLNPRPMYYSQIRVDPLDNNYLYVLGTSLHRSKNAGAEFTEDGGRDVHADCHALWIDPRDPKHMILGTDGGIYVTYDRMENWDHLNHVAIGQFYHVGVDTRRDYKVYGGLQDNGSWGGPSRGAAGIGPINSDWINVGGGDGFVCAVDPENPDIVYTESQNGAMMRMNLRTGQRAGLSPRAPQGARYRFNWKTPFALSPQNSQIFYAIGNHVFRSVESGERLAAISEEITNTDQGSGSAIAVSPLEFGVVYAGTTDGAVWVTRDDGKTWTPIFVKKQAPAADKTNPPAAAAGEHWLVATEASTNRPPRYFHIHTNAGTEGKPTAAIEFDGQRIEASEVHTADDGKQWKIYATWADHDYEFILQRNDQVLTAEITLDFGGDHYLGDGVQIDATAWAAPFDPNNLPGTWQGRLIADVLPADASKIKLTIERNADGSFRGRFETSQGNMDLANVETDEASKAAKLHVKNDSAAYVIDAKLIGGVLFGKLQNESGSLPVKIIVVLEKEVPPSEPTPLAADAAVAGAPPAQAAAAAQPAAAGGERPAAAEAGGSDEPRREMRGRRRGRRGPDSAPGGAAPSGSAPGGADRAAGQDRPAETAAASPPARQEPAADPSDKLSGVWNAQITGGGMGGNRTEFDLTLKRQSDRVTGSVAFGRGDTEIREGSFDEASGKLKLLGENEFSTLELEATLQEGVLKGTLVAGGGRFTIEFEARRQDASTASTPQGQPLESLVPGPRWVSSLTASRFAPSRVYLTLDGHRSNDDAPYVFVSEDYGASWRSLAGNLPATAGTVHVLREDLENENLLFLGCEFSAWVSIDRGQSWTRLSGLPTVAVHEFAISPAAGELVAATHGRSLWIADISSLRQLTPTDLTSGERLLKPNSLVRWTREPARGSSGNRRFVGTNPGSDAKFWYVVNGRPTQIELVIRRPNGVKLRTLSGSTERGLNALAWDLSTGPAPTDGGQRRFRGGGLAAGVYVVDFLVDGALRQSETLEILVDPRLPAGTNAVAEDEVDLFEELPEFFGEID